jgi:hypothetical protein
MSAVPLVGPHVYTDVDRAFWEEHLEGWAPPAITDAHVHVLDPDYRLETITEEMKRSYWVMELQDMQDAPATERCYRTVFPGREVSCLCFGWPSLGCEIEGGNEYVRTEALARGWRSLAVVRPSWRAEQVDWLLSQPGVKGVKPYYAMISLDRSGRDRHIEASIFDYLPHHQLEVLDQRRAWVTLHVPKADRLGHPDNLREVREIRRRYPRIILVIAHLGRCYTEPHALQGLLPLAEDEGLYFDTSAVVNADVHRLALQHIGPKRLLYGSDNPVLYLRGWRQTHGSSYVNRTSLPFHFNREREPAEVEARYTLMMYEDLKGIRDGCEALGYGPAEAEAILHGNAERLLAAANAG